MRQTFLGIGVLVILAGCVRGVNAVLVAREKGEGTAQVYPVDLEKAWNLSRSVLRWERADAIEEHKEGGYMLTTIGANYVSAGSVVGVWVESVDSGTTKVTVISRRRVATDMATGMTESRFHTLFARGVRLVQEGKPLPLTTPPD
ncbi:MAG TPA: hypothetical protein VNO22_04725 [Planctomycetota bacterium]|nr:hypothetical protein [Planctomycetota bacterium]